MNWLLLFLLFAKVVTFVSSSDYHSTASPALLASKDSHFTRKDEVLLRQHRAAAHEGSSAQEAADMDERHEHILHRDLLRSYSKAVRPVRNQKSQLTVRIGMCIMMIEDIVEREQAMITSACLKMTWVDEFLVWDPARYGNLSWISFESGELWIPDIAIVNSPDPLGLTRKQIHVGVSHLGQVGFFPFARLITRCQLIITYFPFDRQNCEIRFESWIHTKEYILIDIYPGPEFVDLKEYYENYQWTLAGFRAQLAVVIYDNKNFSSFTITYRLHRKSMFYFMYFIFPELLVAILQTTAHMLPVEHPGRMALLTALLVGTSVTHSGIVTHIPKSSDTMSVLQIYLTYMSTNLVFVLLVSFINLYTIVRHPKAEPSIWPMLRSFFSVVWPSKEESLTTVSESETEPLLEPKTQNQQLSEQHPHYLLTEEPDLTQAYQSTLPVYENVLPPLGCQLNESVSLVRMDGILYRLETIDYPRNEQPIVNTGETETELCQCHCQLCLIDQDSKYRSLPVKLRKRRGRSNKGSKHLRSTFEEKSKYRRKRCDDLCPSGDRNRSWYGQLEICGCSEGKLKARWRQYCTALDKSFMYFNGTINTVLPVFLFLILPYLNNY